MRIGYRIMLIGRNYGRSHLGSGVAGKLQRINLNYPSNSLFLIRKSGWLGEAQVAARNNEGQQEAKLRKRFHE